MAQPLDALFSAIYKLPMSYRNRYSNLTERVYAVLSIAEDLAGQNAMNPEHIALAILREGQGVAATVVFNIGVRLDGLRRELMDSLPSPGSTAATTHRPSPPSPDADQTIQQATAERDDLGHSYIGTEHLLLALLRDSNGESAKIFARHGVEHRTAKAEILRVLGGPVISDA